MAEIKLCFSGLRLSWLLLAGKRPRGYLQVFVTLNPQSTCHGPRPGPTLCAVLYARAPCMSRSREHEKRPRGRKTKKCRHAKNHIYIYTYFNSTSNIYAFPSTLPGGTPVSAASSSTYFLGWICAMQILHKQPLTTAG